MRTAFIEKCIPYKYTSAELTSGASPNMARVSGVKDSGPLTTCLISTASSAGILCSASSINWSVKAV